MLTEHDWNYFVHFVGAVAGAVVAWNDPILFFSLQNILDWEMCIVYIYALV